MPGPEPTEPAKVVQQPHGCLVPIPRGYLEKMGLDPDAKIVVTRTVFESSDRAEMRLRFREADDQ